MFARLCMYAHTHIHTKAHSFNPLQSFHIFPFHTGLVYHLHIFLEKHQYLRHIAVDQVERKNLDQREAYFGASERGGGRHPIKISVQVSCCQNCFIWQCAGLQVFLAFASSNLGLALYGSVHAFLAPMYILCLALHSGMFLEVHLFLWKQT